jgi:hypothetical protein
MCNFTVTKGRWLKIGKIPSNPHLPVSTPQFIQDKIDPRQFRIYEHGEMPPATREECEALEYASVWAPKHVGQRLRDQYAGRSNIRMKHHKIKD